LKIDKPKVSKILNIALPAATNSLLDMINILVDMIMVGFISSAALAAVGVSMQFLMLNFAFITIFYIGTSALISRLYGGGSFRELNVALFNLLLSAVAVSIPLMFLGLSLNEPYFEWMGLEGESKMFGVEYLGILLCSLPLMFFRMVIIGAFSAIGDTKTPMKIKLFTSLLNFGLDYVFIFGAFGLEGYGVAGAAYATVGVAIVECMVYIYLYIISKNGIYLVKEFDFSYVKRALKIGIPTGIERGLTFSGMVVATKFIAVYGTAVIAGQQAGLRIEGLAFMPGIGFMVASMALMGQSLGREDVEEARVQTILTMFLASFVMGVIGILMAIFSYQLSTIFTDDPDTLEVTAVYLQIIGLSQVPLAVLFVLEGALRGAGATKITLLVNIIGLWGVRLIPIYFFAKSGFPYYYLFFVIFFETYLRAWVFWILFRRGVWMGIKV